MKALLLIVLLAVPVAAQQPEASEPVMKVFPIRNADVQGMANLLSVFGANLKADRNLRVISARGSREQMAAIEDAIKRFDVQPPPQKNVELTFYLLEASSTPGAEKLPADLEPVVKQLRSVLNYQGFRLVDTIFVRARSGDDAQSSSLGAFSGPSNMPKSVTNLRIGRVTISGSEDKPVVSLENLNLGMRIPVPSSTFTNNQGQSIASNYTFQDTGFTTNADVRVGQRVVIGKTSTQGPETAIVAVVTVQVVD